MSACSFASAAALTQLPATVDVCFEPPAPQPAAATLTSSIAATPAKRIRRCSSRSPASRHPVAAERAARIRDACVLDDAERRQHERLCERVIRVEDHPPAADAPVRDYEHGGVQEDHDREQPPCGREGVELAVEQEPDEADAVDERDRIVRAVIEIDPRLAEAARPPAAALPAERAPRIRDVGVHAHVEVGDPEPESARDQSRLDVLA